ncbi:Cro/CI family transcriptional regulator [Cronobacter muytjensii]|uniref:Cro/CI family transcriptional regulator n=1 Tax=Cronobacter sakazakii TaxID=28141 RepID=UPI000A1540D1|nr:Cro/CI family transcriptional regulator [Cronobacter sakazakii]ELY4852488.1 transcriptional regulator [Cronobacter turicensis]AZP33485.1 transcriptional regulator [Cronobacter sakazakii]EIZ8954662.1 transcriptional regulator [Cronobacter sakazakii]ELY2595382.1 transcriptional regulator [Cronobacter sakazakii]MBF4894368.1 transcriptional regulator [Cronobacter sakazakii]
MLTREALNFFGTKTKLARAAGVELQSIYKWKELVPEARAYRLEIASEGALHYDKNLYDEYRKNKRLSRKANTEYQKDSD